MKFYLGTDDPTWLAKPDLPPLFISRRRLSRRNRRSLPRAAQAWALDSGGFTELTIHGRWSTSPERYAADVRRYRDEIGQLAWAAPQDWMCEPHMLAKTGLTVAEHQARTTRNYQQLRALDPTLPFIPVLQGWTLGDYLDHLEQYARAGIDLTAEPLVGIGSVCRRQSTAEIGSIIGRLHHDGLRLHGFGVKSAGLTRYGWALASADSMAWSAAGRRQRPCPHRGLASCAHCIPYALDWAARVAAATTTRSPIQMELQP